MHEDGCYLCLPDIVLCNYGGSHRGRVSGMKMTLPKFRAWNIERKNFQLQMPPSAGAEYVP